MEDKLYTINEIIEMISVTRNTILDWIKTGKIKAVRIGKEYRIRSSQFEEFLQNNEVSNSNSKS